ncbi:anti-sigma factor [Microbulbifer sp. YPW1]|uniref:anti-sigma factor family protein n=1 Tax=Microbulbifer sp. YPW1 TaxID=2745199 RepID=UPI001598ED42|nr:hypothetical protein [Microbulbifer sp. YPW1]QKX16422.1 hypothetical protein HUW35_05130 [Microbulbifer sp. YPW1]
MNCCQARRELELMQRENNGALLKHLHRCSTCREYAEELRLINLLRTMPAPEPSEHFEARVLAAALPKARNQERARVRGWQLATAASLVLAVFATFQHRQPSGPEIAPLSSEMAVADSGVRTTLPVNVSVDTTRAMPGAMISVSLPENLALEGYGDQRELRWRADLNAGANRLTLPVRVRNGQRTEILIRIEHQGAHKEFYVPVDLPSGAGWSESQHAVLEPQTI